MKRDVSIRIGTSGWTYPHWQGVFYPMDRPKSKWLEYYSGRFDTVELNASFYRLPNRTTFEKWEARTPDRFLWSLKASKFITHTRRLKDPAEPLGRLYEASAGLGLKRAVLLFQLPPTLPFDEELFRAFSGALDPGVRHALEIRHPSWVTQRVFDLMSDCNMALCVADTAGRYPYTEVMTADFAYLRLHGSRKLYASDYFEGELGALAEKIRAWDRDTFVYFDNDFEGWAVKNAWRLKELLGIAPQAPAAAPPSP